MANARDIRVDRLGFCDELQKQFRAPLADAVKASMKAGDRADGDAFTALLAGSVRTEIDAEKFVRLWEAGKVTRDQFVSAINVGVARAKELLSESDLKRIATVEDGTPSLRVTRIKTVECSLVDAVKQLSAEIAAGGRS